MGKSVKKEQGKVTEEVIKLYTPEPDTANIIKRTDETGAVSYRVENYDQDLDIYQEDLHDLLSYLLCRIKGIVDLLNEEDWNGLGSIFSVLQKDTERKLDEAFEFVKKEIGHITYDTISYRDPWRGGRIVGISVEPAKRQPVP